MKQDPNNSHPSAASLQAFLEGETSRKEALRIAEHLAACSHCSAEVAGWRVLFDDLGGLSRHRPHEGFAERVMAGVEAPEARSLGARVRERVGDLVADTHIAPDVLQDFLEGSLAARRAERIEEHLEACAGCADEAVAWLDVMRRLDGLETFEPGRGFADSVLNEVQLPEARSLVARARAAVSGLLGRAPEHVPAGLLQDLVDGGLPARAVARIEAHVDDCVVCTRELQAWSSIGERLEHLERFAPSEHFRERVIAALAEPGRATAAVRRPVWSRAAAAGWRLVPQTREAWAALTGVAVTPAVITGLVLYAVFSHPAVTLTSLASFMWWQVSDLATAAATALGSALLQNAEGLGVSTAFELLAAAPTLVAGGVLVYTMASALALRVLWKNLYAHATSTS